MRKPIAGLLGTVGVLSLLFAGCTNPAVTNTTGAPADSGAPGASGAPTSGNTEQAAALPANCLEEKPTIGVALPGTTNPYYVSMQEGFKAAGEKYGFNVNVAIANDNDSTQRSQIDAFIQQKVCAVGLNVVNSGPGAASVVALNNAGIPVFTVNIIVDEEALKTQGGSIVQYVGADAFASGQLMGEQALADLGADANLVIGFVGKPDQVQTNIRDDGFRAGIASNPNAEVVATVDGKIDPNVSLQVTTEMLQGHSDMNVVWANTGPAAVGALQAIKQLGRAGEVSLYALCADQVAIDDTYRACVAQEPAHYAEVVVQSIRDHIDGKPVEPKVLLPMVVVTEGMPAPGLYG